MNKDKRALIDIKTHKSSLIILFVSILVAAAVFIDIVLDDILTSAIAVLFYIIYILCYLAIIGIILSAILEKDDIKNKMKEKQIFKRINNKLALRVIVLFILVILTISIFSLKPYSGLSVKDLKSNPEMYENKTVTIQAWYLGSGDKGHIYQKDYFSEDKEYVTVHLKENIDRSMLIAGQEFYFTGVIEVGNYVGGGTFPKMEVTKILPLYEDLERHDTSKFIGTWKKIEDNNEPVSSWDNKTYVFYENNSYQFITNATYISKENSNLMVWTEGLFITWGHYVVDGDILYYCDEYGYKGGTGGEITLLCYGKYYFSENNTILTIDETDHRSLIRSYEKIE